MDITLTINLLLTLFFNFLSQGYSINTTSVHSILRKPTIAKSASAQPHSNLSDLKSKHIPLGDGHNKDNSFADRHIKDNPFVDRHIKDNPFIDRHSSILGSIGPDHNDSPTMDSILKRTKRRSNNKRKGRRNNKTNRRRSKKFKERVRRHMNNIYYLKIVNQEPVKNDRELEQIVKWSEDKEKYNNSKSYRFAKLDETGTEVKIRGTGLYTVSVRMAFSTNIDTDTQYRIKLNQNTIHKCMDSEKNTDGDKLIQVCHVIMQYYLYKGDVLTITNAYRNRQIVVDENQTFWVFIKHS